jgi:polysaccharide biosynthesis/export protein
MGQFDCCRGVGESMRIFLALLFFFGGFLTNALAQQGALRAGDAISISVWQDPKLDRTIVISPDGYISLPLVGQIKASGLSPPALADVLKQRLQKNYTGDLDVTVALAAPNREAEDELKPRVYVTGEVLRPGPYLLKPPINLMQAISLAGGLSPFAARQRIQIHRKVRGIDSIFTFDYNAFETGRIATDNISLQAGDIIIVPERGLFE